MSERTYWVYIMTNHSGTLYDAIDLGSPNQSDSSENDDEIPPSSG